MLPSLLEETVNNAKENKKSNPLPDQSLQNYISLNANSEAFKSLVNNSFVYNKPMSTVGGDGFWYEEIDGYIILVVYDCMGHGRLASMMTRKYQDAIKKTVLEQGIQNPSEILLNVHQLIEKQFKGKEASMIGSAADMSVIRFKNTVECELLQYAGAKMNLYYIMDKNLHKVKADKVQIGEYFDYPHKYQTVDIDMTITKKYRFFISTDGIADLIGGSKNKKFGNSNLKQMMLDTQKKDLHSTKKFIEKNLHDWVGDYPQTDDMLMIGFDI